MKVYLIEERYDDVFCENSDCRRKINCSRRIHMVTLDRQEAVNSTKDRPNWGYQEYELGGAPAILSTQ